MMEFVEASARKWKTDRKLWEGGVGPEIQALNCPIQNSNPRLHIKFYLGVSSMSLRCLHSFGTVEKPQIYM